MAEDIVELLAGLFSDIRARAPMGVTWSTSGRQIPLRVEVTPADFDTGSFAVDRLSVAEAVVRFAEQVQEWLTPRLGTAVPPCPTDAAPLSPRVIDGSPQWVCANDEFRCGFGGYLRSLWPPDPADPLGSVILSARLSDHGVRWISSAIALPEGVPTAQVKLLPGEDEATVRSLLAPFSVEVNWGEARSTERFSESTPTGRFRGLRLRGGGPHWMAALAGELGRPNDDEDADVLVRGQWVRLGPDHRIGGPGEPLLLEADGTPFADVGDITECGGGHPPPTGVRGERRPFYAWQIRIRED